MRGPRPFAEWLELLPDERAQLELEPWQLRMLDELASSESVTQLVRIQAGAARRRGRRLATAQLAAIAALAGEDVVITCTTTADAERLYDLAKRELETIAQMIGVDASTALERVRTQTPGNPGRGITHEHHDEPRRRAAPPPPASAADDRDHDRRP